MRIRKVKNSAGNTVVQVGRYQGKRFILSKHIGSASSDFELNMLLEEAHNFINQDNISLFHRSEIDSLLPIGYSHKKIYQYFKSSFEKIFPLSSINSVFRDLVIMRIIKPTSKLESIELLKEYFGIKHSYASVYRELLRLDKKILVEQLVNYAKEHLSFDFSLLFYDVTTLYFESKPDDILKIPGYSKDGKHSKPQIMIGLVVDSNGFPVYYDIFKGNSFEGHTMVPIITEFKSKFDVKNLTVIADSAMLSQENLSLLEANRLNYIVGNRKASNFSKKYRQIIKKLKEIDNSTHVLREGSCYIVFHFSKKREKKDLYEIKKAQQRAERAVKSSTESRKKKYVKEKSKQKEVNYELIQKHMYLAGIKSYRTNIEIPADLVISRYNDLWKVEKSFRMSKHDLKARPIFHRKEETIRAHIQIVFAANAIARRTEIETGKSIKQNVKELMREIEVQFKDKNSGKIISFSIKPH